MPRYEILAHITRDLACASAEEAAAIVRRQILAESGSKDALVHLAVWREDPAPAASPLPAPLRHMLVDLFATLDRCAGDAEMAFRARVAAILSAAPAGAGDGTDVQQVMTPERIEPL
jgi:hypothetical protein